MIRYVMIKIFNDLYNKKNIYIDSSNSLLTIVIYILDLSKILLYILKMFYLNH